jgi:hypothetical protein
LIKNFRQHFGWCLNFIYHHQKAQLDTKMKLLITIIPLLLALKVACALPLACPDNTSGGVIYLEGCIDLDIGNAPCSDNQKEEMTAALESALLLSNGTMADDSIAFINANLSGSYNDTANGHRALKSTFTYTFRASESIISSL